LQINKLKQATLGKERVMHKAFATSFVVSDVPLARQPLYEIPYPHAVAGLISAKSSSRELSELDRTIRDREEIRDRLLPELLKDPLAEPLPSWTEDNRRMGYPEEAEAELARRRADVPLRREKIAAMERELTELKQRRSQLVMSLDARLQTTSPRIEACSRYHGHLVADVVFHPLMAALHRAFSDHRPISLSPDMIWLLIAQGVASHINAHAEKLRSRFVQHQDKITLKVRRDDFIKGSPENPWAEVFPAFSQQIRQHVGDRTYDFFMATFSTTGPEEKSAFEIVLMDAVQSYFNYELQTICGIPAITLEGTPRDWRAILDRVQMLPDFDLGWWLPALQEALQQFVEAAEGRPDLDFWRSLYKFREISGGSEVTGWINAFFPYFRVSTNRPQMRQNPWLAKGLEAMRGHAHPERRPKDGGPSRGPGIDRFPSGLARAPLLWRYYGQEYDMRLFGGFIGVAQDSQTLCLRPEIGWAVR
jgi:hypothetical protein